MKLMELLERFVVATEKIAEAMQRQEICGNNGAASIANVPGTATEKGFNDILIPPVADTFHATLGPVALNREDIKKELTARSIPFKTGAKTETLQKLLESVGKVGAGKEEEQPGNPFVETKVPAGEASSTSIGGAPIATKEQARDYLVALSAMKGPDGKGRKDEALSVLKVQGKAEKLSDVDPSRYGLIVDTCKVRGVTINA